ncbi:MAG TPA: DUF1338 domain-containing protein [Fibrobacteria bacterium]|nr:DUF1338 domain-containing protein [Fibrobacteria bacterium]
MGTLQDLLDLLWRDYSALNPQARRIHDLLEGRGETIVNDHIAFRTFAYPGMDVKAMAAPYVALGYRPGGEYVFPEKKLTAVHYRHPDPLIPKIFISQIHLDLLSAGSRSMLLGLINQVPREFLARPDWSAGGRPWNLDFTVFEALERESEYAAWMSAFGFRANHFTVFANALRTFPHLSALNDFLKARGFRLNASGGEIKGNPGIFLEQSSTLANEADAPFRDGVRKVPGCYYEFARRYPMPDGALFQGFNDKSADKIFESTDRKSR